jgi:hypothetical protein
MNNVSVTLAMLVVIVNFDVNAFFSGAFVVNDVPALKRWLGGVVVSDALHEIVRQSAKPVSNEKISVLIVLGR